QGEYLVLASLQRLPVSPERRQLLVPAERGGGQRPGVSHRRHAVRQVGPAGEQRGERAPAAVVDLHLAVAAEARVRTRERVAAVDGTARGQRTAEDAHEV